MSLRCLLGSHDHRDGLGNPVGPCTRCGLVRWGWTNGYIAINYIPGLAADLISHGEPVPGGIRPPKDAA